MSSVYGGPHYANPYYEDGPYYDHSIDPNRDYNMSIYNESHDIYLEADTKNERHLKVSLIDVDKLVKVNELKPVSNPVAFVRRGVPTSDGLWSNEIFGITQYQRANTFAYVDLHEEFINPLIYKLWCKLDPNIKFCVHGIKNFIINDRGQLQEDENGSNGIDFIKKNISKYKFRRTESSKRDMNIDFIKSYLGKPEFFITKYIVIPAYYRDINTDTGGRITIDGINALYRSLLISVKALRESADYGLSLSAATRGRIQETLVSIYDWFGSGTTVNGDDVSGQLPGKFGIIRRSVMSKTTDYASRLVLSSPQLRVETTDDIECDLEYCLLPLASALANFYPFAIFHAKRILENEFSTNSVIAWKNPKTNEYEYLHPKDYQTEFSEERIRKEIERFLTGFSNRFIPIKVPTVEGPEVDLIFKGRNVTPEEFEKNPKTPIMERPFTWCDLFYIAVSESVVDRCVLITRYPINLLVA